MHFKHEMIVKHFTETSNKVELRINRVRINHAQPVTLNISVKTVSLNFAFHLGKPRLIQIINQEELLITECTLVFLFGYSEQKKTLIS